MRILVGVAGEQPHKNEGKAMTLRSEDTKSCDRCQARGGYLTVPYASLLAGDGSNKKTAGHILKLS